MQACFYCGDKKTKFTCPTCGKSFCFEHTGSTDKIYCKIHPNIYLTRAQYERQDHKCTVVVNGHCPRCNSSIYVFFSNDGTKYLQCASCDWNSLESSPKIISENVGEILKEAFKHKLTNYLHLCEKRLRVEKGKEFCLNCLIENIKKLRMVNYSALGQFGVDYSNAGFLLKNLIREKLLSGIIDEKYKIFIYIDELDEIKIMDLLRTQGYIDMEQIAKILGIRPESSMAVMLYLIRKNKLHGTFTIDRERYYSRTGITQILLKELKKSGHIKHSEFAMQINVYEEIIKNYILNDIIKPQMLQARFTHGAKETATIEYLENEIIDYCNKHGIFHLDTLANHIGAPVEYTRRLLFNLIQKGVIRGVFTQKREFITEDELTERIKMIARAYKESPLSELAAQLAITERRVEETLAALISRGAVNGYIDRAKKLFIADKEQPITKFGKYRAPYMPPTNQDRLQSPPAGAMGSNQPAFQPQGSIEVLRQYDFVGGQLHFKVVVRNNSNMAIHDIKVILDVPSSYKRSRDMITISVIDPGNSHGVDFYLEPRECGISSIGGTVLYKDAMGQTHSINIRKKEVQIKCPLVIPTLDTMEDCVKVIKTLPSDARAFLIADLPPELAYAAAYRAVSQFDTRNVESYENTEGTYEAEAWFSAEAKVTGGRIVIRIYFNGANSTLEIRVWCSDAGQLTGLLAKIVELFFNEINFLRKIKTEERNKTIDVMAITRNLMEIKDICMTRYLAHNARIKLEDLHSRIQKIGINDKGLLQKIYNWIKLLEERYPEEDAYLEDDDADKLELDMESIHQYLKRTLGEL